LRLPSINFIICFGDDTLYAAAAAELDEECEAEREECEVDNETRVEREGAEAEPKRDEELDLGEEEDREEEDREADEDDIELLAAGDILLYCSGVPDEGLPFVILRLTIACNIRACAFSIP
jgi:hypothetical protein